MRYVNWLYLIFLTTLLCACGGDSILDKKALSAQQSSAEAPPENGIIFSNDNIRTSSKPNLEGVLLALDEQLLDRKEEVPLSKAQFKNIKLELVGAQADLFKIETRTIKDHASIRDGEHTVLLFNPNMKYFYDDVQGRCDGRNCLVTVKATTSDSKQAIVRVQVKLLEQDKFKINKVNASLKVENEEYVAKTVIMLARATSANSPNETASNHFYVPMYEIMKGVIPKSDSEGNIDENVMKAFWRQSVPSALEFRQLKYQFFDDNTADSYDDSERFGLSYLPFDGWQRAIERTEFLKQKNKSLNNEAMANFYAGTNNDNIKTRLQGQQVPVVAFKAPSLAELKSSGRLQSNIALKEGNNDARNCTLFTKVGPELNFYGPYRSSLLITPTDPDNLPIRLNLVVYVIDDALPLAVYSFTFKGKIINTTNACWPVDYNDYSKEGVDVRYVSFEQLQDAIKWSDATFGNPSQ